MAPETNFLEFTSSPLLLSVRKTLILVEAIVILFIGYQSGFDPTYMLMSVIITALHIFLYSASLKSDFNLYPFGLPVSFGLVLYFNHLSPKTISFAGYIVSLVFFSIFLVKNRVLQISFTSIFIGGICISEYLKGLSIELILMILIPSTGFTILFYTAIVFLEKTRSQLVSQNKYLQDAKASLDSLLENTQSYIWCLDKQLNYIRGNSNFELRIISLYKSKVIPGQNMLRFPVNEGEDIFWHQLYNKALMGETIVQEKVYKDESGERTMEHTLNPMFDTDKNVYGLTVISKNITRKKAIEKEQKKNQELLNLILNKMPIGFQLYDEKGNLLMANERLTNYLNLSLDHPLLKSFNILSHPFMQKSGISDRFTEALSSGQILEFETEIDFSQRENPFPVKGSNTYLDITLFRLQDDNKETYGMVMLVNDISTRKRHEKLLIEQNRRFEEYSFTLSHIIRRPVANIISLSRLLKEYSKIEDEDQITIEHIHESVRQLDEIIQNLNLNLNSNQTFIL